MSKISYYTKDGLDKLKNELSHLKSKGRADIARQIADARDKGDLSENAEYDAAKDAQGHLEAKIAQLEDLVSNARLLDENNIDTSKVSILCKVTSTNVANKKTFTYQLVSEQEAVDEPHLKGADLARVCPAKNDVPTIRRIGAHRKHRDVLRPKRGALERREILTGPRYQRRRSRVTLRIRRTYAPHRRRVAGLGGG